MATDTFVPHARAGAHIKSKPIRRKHLPLDHAIIWLQCVEYNYTLKT